MVEKTIDVIGLGNPLLDLLIEVEDLFLDEINFEKGGMHLIDEEKSEEILKTLSESKIVQCAGGSCANTVAGVAYLGGKSAFCGVIGDDEHGKTYEVSLSNENLKSNLVKLDKKTGHAIALITPDSERTMMVHLGAAIEFKKHHVIESDIKDAKVFHIEAYQLEGDGSKEAVLHATKIAKENGTKVSIDLADSFLIERNFDLFKDIVENYADIVFMNETEAKAFTGFDDEKKALDYLGQFCEIAIVKIGSKGSLIKKDGVVYEIEPVLVDCVDTTGAGDNYASGVLYGITNGLSIEESGKLGSAHAAKVVAQIGARLN